ncbi:MAG: metal ABC transporter permease [Eubacteriales bacterium]|nr:metal ABC transporter permease [Eubacteriales bacterium]
MLSIFRYDFMQKALIVAAVLGIIMPCIGVTVVLRRLSMIGDALAHASLAGVALGLLFNFNPVFGATLACIIAALSIERIRQRVPEYAEISITVILSAGIGIAGVLSSWIPSANTMNSFLFGSIVAISWGEVWSILAVSLFVLIVYLFLYKELFYLSLDEESARLAAVPVRSVNAIFTILTALTVALASRTVGSLIVASIMVIPVACSLRLARSYFQTLLYSIFFGLAFVLGGLILSYYFQVKPGATIVLIAVLCLSLILVTEKLRHAKF